MNSSDPNPNATNASATPEHQDRRPLAVRDAIWAKRIAGVLSAQSITPNQISVLSVVFALMGAAAFAWVAQQGPAWALVVAAFCIQARLLCNLFDGMVAVEGGKSTPTGGLYNDVPDRLADPLFLVAAGYAAQLDWLGWLAALLAVLTAYIRALSASLGLPHDFSGPMAKQHRMAILTIACLLGCIELWHWQSLFGLQLALAVIAFGSGVTCARRLHRAAKLLNCRAQS